MMASKDQELITQFLYELGFRSEHVEFEHYIGSLRLDIYIPKYALAIEYHGKQHFEFVGHFHGTNQGFLEAIKRDFDKVQACKDVGITLIAFDYRDKITKDLVYERLVYALDNPVPEVEAELTYEEKMKKKAKEIRKERYREFKRRSKLQ